MADKGTPRQFILGSGFFVIAIVFVLFLIEHDLFVFLALPVVILVLLLLEARQRLSTKS